MSKKEVLYIYIFVSKNYLNHDFVDLSRGAGMGNKANLRKHEILGLFYQLIGATSVGVGIYYAVWFAVKPLVYGSVALTPSGSDWWLFPLFFGLGGLLWTLGGIEIKEALPGHRRK